MAGRPASRGSGMTGVHYGLIAFVIVSVLALAAFIWQLTQNNALREETERLQRNAREFGSPPNYYATEAQARNTGAFRIMDEHLSDYAELLTGNAEAFYPGVKAQFDRALDEAAREHQGAVSATSSVLDTLRRMSTLWKQDKDNLRVTGDQLTEAQRKIADLTAQNQIISEDFQSAMAQIKDDYQAAEQRYTSALSEKEAQREELQASLDRASQELQELKVKVERGQQVKDQEVASLIDQVQSLRQKIQDLQGPGLDPDAILRKADGKVLRAVPGSDVVYVSLGEADGLKVGMGFEVFSQVGDASGARGKASLEVSSLSEQTAECRVVRETYGDPIIAGDFIVNIIFERNRRPKFVVRGDFDPDYDGLVGPNGGRDQIAGLVHEWGGQVVDELDETTDFVVVGTSPYIPALTPAQTTPVTVTQTEQRRLRNSEFQELIAKARSMYIPVITQSQFLFLTGYSDIEFAQR